MSDARGPETAEASNLPCRAAAAILMLLAACILPACEPGGTTRAREISAPQVPPGTAADAQPRPARSDESQGCVQRYRHAAAPAVPPPAWQPLMADGLKGWHVVQGEAREAGEHTILLNPSGRGRATIAARDLDVEDSTLEMSFRRRPGENPDAPVTVALRARRLLGWSCVYVILRPGSLELARGTHLDPLPETERVAEFPPAAAGEAVQWRFELQGPSVRLLRNGETVFSWLDDAPQSGTLALTCDGCVLELLDARVQHTARTGDAP